MTITRRSLLALFPAALLAALLPRPRAVAAATALEPDRVVIGNTATLVSTGEGWGRNAWLNGPVEVFIDDVPVERVVAVQHDARFAWHLTTKSGRGGTIVVPRDPMRAWSLTPDGWKPDVVLWREASDG